MFRRAARFDREQAVARMEESVRAATAHVLAEAELVPGGPSLEYSNKFQSLLTGRWIDPGTSTVERSYGVRGVSEADHAAVLEAMRDHWRRQGHQPRCFYWGSGILYRVSASAPDGITLALVVNRRGDLYFKCAVRYLNPDRPRARSALRNLEPDSPAGMRLWRGMAWVGFVLAGSVYLSLLLLGSAWNVLDRTCARRPGRRRIPPSP